MSEAQWQEQVRDYIDKTRFGVLGYLRQDRSPLLRSMGSFVPDGVDLYFSSGKTASKVSEIAATKRISFLFEHDNQELHEWRNVLLVGEAHPVHEGAELDRAVALLSGRNPRFKARVEKGELPLTQIFKLKTEEVEFLDYGKGFGHVEKVVLKQDGPA